MIAVNSPFLSKSSRSGRDKSHMKWCPLWCRVLEKVPTMVPDGSHRAGASWHRFAPKSSVPESSQVAAWFRVARRYAML